jgi:hypothetical protein
MAKNILDIIIRMIKEGGGDKETIKALADIKHTVVSAMSTFAAFAGVAYTADKAFQATVGTYVKTAEETRRLAEATEMSIGETSRLIKVADDLGISYESLTKIMKSLSSAGIEPSLEGLAQFSDKYQALGDPMKQNELLLKTFAKNWVDAAQAVKVGGDGLRTLGQQVEKGLILDDRGVQAAHEYTIAMDDQADSARALALAFGGPALEAMVNWLNWTTDLKNAQREAIDSGKSWALMTDEERQSLIEAAKAAREYRIALLSGKDASGEFADSIEAINYKGLAGDIKNTQDETDRYVKTGSELHAQFVALNPDAKDYTDKLIENQHATMENEQAHRKWAANQAFGWAEAQVAAEGYTKAGVKNLIAFGVQKGIFSEETAAMVTAAHEEFNKIFDSTAPIQEVDKLEQRVLDLVNGKYSINISVNFAMGGIPLPTPVAAVNIYGQRAVGAAPGRQSGGLLEAGDVYQVHQDELFVSSRSGYMLTRAEAMRIAGARGNDNSRRFVNYGPITIVAPNGVRSALEELT